MQERKLFRKTLLAFAVGALIVGYNPVFADDDDDDEVEITFIHSGDFHGDYHPHTNGRADNAGSLEGGMARAVTVINKIRAKEDNVIHVHTGDTIHGSGEASITKGMALVKLVDQLGIDVSTPGNWEWAYTPYRYMQFFGVHDKKEGGTNMDIIPNADFDEGIYKAVKYSTDPDAHEDDKAGNVPTFGTSFREVKYVSGFDADGNPIMKSGYNRWGMVAANAYQNGTWKLDHGVAEKGTGMNITPPYRIIEKEGVKIGFIGCTTNRGPQVVSSTITTGVSFSNCKGGIKFPQNRPIDWENKDKAYGGKNRIAAADPAVEAFNRDTAKEIPIDTSDNIVDGWDRFPHWGGNWGYQVQNEIVKWTNYLRNVEGVDLVAVMSEAGIAENIYAAEHLGGMENGPDIYFSSDMHEEANYPVVVTDPNDKKVIIIENPEDINQISKLEIEVKNGKIVEWEFKGIDVNENITPNSDMKDMVAQIDQEISDKIDAGLATNPYNNHKIDYQLTDTVGQTEGIVLERNRFTTEWDPANKIMPGVIEGTGHALITDMFRKFTGADVGGLRGFRYTNSVLDGDDITYKALYHMFPIGAQVAVAAIPSTPADEPAPNLAKDEDGNLLGDVNGNGLVLEDHTENKRHYIGFPRSLQMEMELGMNSSHNPNVPKWGGGWSWNYSGIKWDSQPAGSQFNKYGKKLSARISNIVVYDDAGNETPIADMDNVNYASYYYHEDSNRINRNQIVTKGFCIKKGYAWPAQKTKCADEKGKIKILAKTAGGDYVMTGGMDYEAGIASGALLVLDATEALGRYISDATIDVFKWDGAKSTDPIRTVAGLGGTFAANDFVYPRANLIKADGSPGNDLTDCTIEFGFPCIQPMRGSEAAVIAGKVTLDTPYGTADKPSLEGEFGKDDDDEEDDD